MSINRNSIELRHDLTSILTDAGHSLWERDSLKRIYLHNRFLVDLWENQFKKTEEDPRKARSKQFRLCCMFNASKVYYDPEKQTLEGDCPKNVLIKIKKGLTKNVKSGAV